MEKKIRNLFKGDPVNFPKQYKRDSRSPFDNQSKGQRKRDKKYGDRWR